MIHTLRKLARELHRRSVWQVLVGYLVVAWIVQLLVETATGVLGLPRWTPTMAFVLLAIGLPIMLATAVAQGGPKWLAIPVDVDPDEVEARTPDQVLVVPEAHPLHGVGLFTWRNAILGGVMAGALLITSVVAYLAMWALGIGPVGSLVASGVLSEGDTIAVADFVDRTATSGLGERVGTHVRQELARSQLVHVLDAASTRSSGARAVVAGEISSDAGGYRLVARIMLADGTVVAALQQVFATGDEVTGSRLLATKLRERLGESLRSILDEVPTGWPAAPH